MEASNFDKPGVSEPSMNPSSPSRHHYRSRLPTPETAYGSNGATRDSTISPAYKRPRYDPVSNQSYASEPVSRKRSFDQLSRSRRDSVVHPPLMYTTHDAQKPSLPSLRSVLNGNDISPPKTPSPRQTQSELSRVDTVLPALPAHYIHTPTTVQSSKRQKLDYADIQPRFFTPPVHGSLDQQLRPSVSLPSLSSHLSTLDSCRNTTSRATNNLHSGSSPLRPGLYTPIAEQYRSSTERPSVDRIAPPLYTPDRTPTSHACAHSDSIAPSVHEPYYPCPSDNRDASFHRDHNEVLYPRMHASRCCGGHSPHGHDRDYPVHLPPHSEQRSSVSSTEGSYHVREHAFCEPGHPHLVAYGSGPYAAMPGSTYYASSYFDYQQGKSRKRSNLPKHSTEVMKQWFDQNIQNPYPSEEQKQRFSNITGISMTQVSNWFINHRRRCPELRDKRDKGRGGRDDEP